MLKSNQFALQYRQSDNDNWEYVFCHISGRIISTKDHSVAIIGDNHSLNYFNTMFANYQFRLSK